MTFEKTLLALVKHYRAEPEVDNDDGLALWRANTIASEHEGMKLEEN